ncbi:putative RNA-dependent RNA polymerase 1 [Halotydeus destructor]|nr:putative RNA-dependent RNA polymerase 1 [Halotydeus destructor]
MASGNNLLHIGLTVLPEHGKTAIDLQTLRRKVKTELQLEQVDLKETTLSQNSRLYVEDSELKRYSGHFRFVQPINTRNAQHFLKKFVASEELKSVFLSIENRSSEKIHEFQFEPKQEIQLDSFSLGSIVDMDKFVEHFNTNALSLPFKCIKDSTKGIFEHGKGKMNIEFQVHNPMETDVKKYQLTTTFSEVHSMIFSPLAKHFVVYIILKSRLLLYVNDPSSNNRNGRVERDYWLRSADAFGLERQVVGKSNVLKLVFNQVESDRGDYTRKNHRDPWSLVSNFRLFSDKRFNYPTCFGGLQVHVKKNQSFETQIPRRFSYSIGYALECLMNVSFQVEDELSIKGVELQRRFYDSVVLNSRTDSKAAESAIYEIFNAIDRNSVVRVLSAFNEIFARLLSKKTPDVECLGVSKIRRIVFTPTRTIFLPPHPFVESRFLRDSDPEYAVRLVVKDDNDDSLTFSACGTGGAQGQKIFLREYVKKPLLKGIQIYDRKYELMGSSSSQLRQHGFIFYAKDSSGRTAKDIRENVGDLRKIRAVPKYMARLGLAFSQAMAYVTISNDDIMKMNDITGGRNPVDGKPYTFSDGVGMISEGLVEKICTKMRIQGALPSAFQIRLKGCKGLVTLNPLVPSGKIVIRSSMNKFESESTSLEILKFSKNRPVYLNRPLITILEQLGTKKEVILKMQVEALKELTNAFFCDQKAMKLLKAHSSTLCAVVPVEKAVNAGINILNEPFFRKALDAVVKRCVWDLKNKARIKVDQNKGRIMFGAVDDTHKLEYGEIFVQYSTDGEPNRILDGEIMVTKYPCMHPGDVRKFTAVDVPSLHHIVDTIIFPSKGPRPHPDEMAGSDLDGDEYSVIWDKNLYFAGSNRDAMHFPINKADELARDVNEDDMLEFFITFIQSNIVGVVANSHLAFADRWVDPVTKKEGIFTEACLELCRKYAINLDFAKNGKFESLLAHDRPQIFPDFMQKHCEKPTYQSRRTLGDLYRQISLFELSLDDSSLDTSQSTTNPKSFAYPGWEKFEKEATDAYDIYKRSVQNLLKQFGVDDECAFIANAFTKSSKYLNKKDAGDLQDMIEMMVRALFEQHRKKFESYANDYSLTKAEKLAKASAYYQVSLRCNQNATVDVVYGFPWIVTDELIQVYQHCRSKELQEEELSPRKAVVKRLNERLEDPNYTTPMKFEAGAKLLQENWLRNQTHLRLGIENSEKALQDLLGQELTKVKTNYYLKKITDSSPGSIVIEMMENLVANLFQAGLNDASKNMLGISAVSTLNRIFRSRDPLRVLYEPMTENDAEVRVETFFIALKLNQSFDRLVNDQRPSIQNYLKESSGVEEIEFVDQETGSGPSLLISALGSPWSLLKLREILTNRKFYTKTVEHFAVTPRRHS